LCGVADAAAGFGGGDAHDVGEDFGDRPAQGRVAAAIDETEEVKCGGCGAAADGFQPVERFQAFSDRHGVPVQRSDRPDGGIQPVEGRHGGCRTHVRKTTPYD
jgi:hypothetical protein